MDGPWGTHINYCCIEIGKPKTKSLQHNVTSWKWHNSSEITKVWDAIFQWSLNFSYELIQDRSDLSACCQEFHKIRKFFQKWQFAQFSNSSGKNLFSLPEFSCFGISFYWRGHFEFSCTLAWNYSMVFQNLTELTNDERESIIRVLKRDAELNDLESERVFRLKRILKDFKRRGIGKDRVSVHLNYSDQFSMYRSDCMIWIYIV